MFAVILNVLTGGLLDKLLGFVERGQAQRLAAMNDTQRQVYADKADARQAAKEIRLATAGFWEMRLLTFLIAAPFVTHLWSIWLDTQFKFGWRIDKFPDPFNEWEGAILLSFFGVSVVGSGIKAVAGAIAYRKR